MSGDERLGDALFTGLRLADGRRSRTRFATATASTSGSGTAPISSRFVDAGLLRREGDRLRLTRQGMLLAHEVMAVFV